MSVDTGPEGFINEIFYSLQGEVPGIGIPSIFVRFSKCNLSCDFCDTKYALEKGEPTFLQCIIPTIDRLGDLHDCQHVVFTGGEPLLQKEFLRSIMDELYEMDYEMSIETNGTIDMSGLNCHDFRYIAVSPKIKHHRYREIIDKYKEMDNVYFKLVHTSDYDVIDMIEFYGLPKCKLVIMPLAASKEELEKNELKTWKLCHSQGFRMGYRLQIKIHGNKRGI